jgi:hypothetical protein
VWLASSHATSSDGNKRDERRCGKISVPVLLSGAPSTRWPNRIELLAETTIPERASLLLGHVTARLFWYGFHVWSGSSMHATVRSACGHLRFHSARLLPISAVDSSMRSQSCPLPYLFFLPLFVIPCPFSRVARPAQRHTRCIVRSSSPPSGSQFCSNSPAGHIEWRLVGRAEDQTMGPISLLMLGLLLRQQAVARTVQQVTAEKAMMLLSRSMPRRH